MENQAPETITRAVVDECADCDICRALMDSTCLLFPELYRLYDKEAAAGQAITAPELRSLVELCNFCAICPCPNIRADIMQAKTAFVDREGLKPGIRLLEDVQRAGKLCGAFPRLANFLFQNRRLGGLLKFAVGIHRKRNLPEIPEQSFEARLQQKISCAPRHRERKRRVVFFAGCTGRYFFPGVPEAAVDVLQRNGIAVVYPPQQCCGMPTLLEGDRKLTLKFVGYNVKHLAAAVDNGYDVVCSCPTCGFMLKKVLKEGAYYSSEYQTSVGADALHIKIPRDPHAAGPEAKPFALLKKSLYQGVLKDDGYFRSISARKRIAVAENTYDLGEYLNDLRRAGELNTDFGALPGHSVYYPPCHLREQNVGRPYLDLMALVPEMGVESIEGMFDCCGMGGIMGFKRQFHAASIKMGSRLIAKIKAKHPRRLITDCLSCRLQFRQMTPYRVFHPVEILRQSYVGHPKRRPEKPSAAIGE